MLQNLLDRITYHKLKLPTEVAAKKKVGKSYIKEAAKKRALRLLNTRKEITEKILSQEHVRKLFID